MAKKIIVKVSWQYIPVSVLIVSKKNITTNFVVTFAYFLTRVQSVFFLKKNLLVLLVQEFPNLLVHSS